MALSQAPAVHLQCVEYANTLSTLIFQEKKKPDARRSGKLSRRVRYKKKSSPNVIKRNGKNGMKIIYKQGFGDLKGSK